MPQRTIKKIGIITKSNANENEKTSKIVEQLTRYLKKNNKEIYEEPKYSKEDSAKALDTRRQKNFDRSVLSDTRGSKFFDNTVDSTFAESSKSDLLKEVDLAVVLGGDGTILKTAREISQRKVLILGINTGSLGFLTECQPEKMEECLDTIFKGKFQIDKRSVLRVTLYRNRKKLSTYLAFNDAAINQGAFARLIQMNLEFDGRKVVKFRGDGVIVSTPTGSTGHSLSAGGPIVHPHIEGLLVTPVCPRTLSMRPIVIPDNKQLVVTIETQRKDENAIIGLTLDGQDVTSLKFGDKIKIRKSKRAIYLVRTQNKYYRMLRNKLNWGE